MHLYNAWLPPPVAELAVKEKDAFADVVTTVKTTWRPDDPDSVYGTLKWISILDSFIKAKSEIALEDVMVLVEVGLELFLQSENLYVQVRWGNLLARLVKKFGKKLDLTIQWRPFYDLLIQTHFARYYHPSNGGRWSYSLERFLRYLVYYFQKRLTQEQRNREAGAGMVHHFLGSSERAAFVKVVLKLIERGQYSKNEALAGTAAAAASVLSYVEPSLVLPLIVSRFHIALDTITATHQLKSAVTAVALVSRALLLASAKPPHLETDNSDCISSPVDYNNVLMVSMYNTLLGMDANDPPKTLATMQLFGSIFSSLAELGDKEDGNRVMLDINFSEWLDEFLCRIFSLLLHLEPNNQLNEGLHLLPASGTFLIEDGPFYFCMLEILLGKLTRPLFLQVRESIGATLCVLCTNIRLSSSFIVESSSQIKSFDWSVFLPERASLAAIKIQSTNQSAVFDQQLITSDDKNDKDSTEQQEHIKWMETAFHFIISALRSGRGSCLTDIIVGLLCLYR